MAIVKLKRIAIHNYKSLRYVELFPAQSDFTVLVGRNGAGKSNLADAFDFIQLAYKSGLEHAVARKGGYENIAHRKERRSRTAISFEVELTLLTRLGELMPEYRRMDSSVAQIPATILLRHRFSFKATGQGIRSEFVISEEVLEVTMTTRQEDLFGGLPSDRVVLTRTQDGSMRAEFDEKSRFATAVLFEPRFWTGSEEGGGLAPLPKTELMSAFPYIRSTAVGRVFNWLQRISTFQLTPEVARNPGVPTPNPALSSHGENLPAVVDWLKRHHASDWKAVLATMREIVPEIEDIEVDYLHTRTLGIFFKEEGVGRAWTSDEVSDGTIRSLAILVACHDPRSSVLFIEEPENSLHPWIIKVIMNSLRKISTRRPVLITTHSPLILNSVSPDEVWVVFKKHGETQLAPLPTFDDQLVSDWSEGRYKLFDYLESGYVSEAVPSGA